MYNLYPNRPTTLKNKILVPDWVQVRNVVSTRLLKVVNFYRDNPRTVGSDHLLVKLLGSLNVSTSIEDRRYVDVITDISSKLAGSLKLTSSFHRGKVFDGEFYGDGMTEIIVSTDEAFDLDVERDNWEDIEGVKVLSHPKTDLAVNLPDGKANGSEIGLAVIEINIPLLAFQYKKWRNHIKTLGLENQPSTMMFIHQYVLPNMLSRHLDIALYNRFTSLYNGDEMLPSKVKNGLFLVDYSKKVDAIYKKLIATILKRQQTLDGFLANVPMVTSNDSFDLIILPDVIKTRQITWVLFLARLRFIKTALDIYSETESNKNKKELNRIKRTIKELRSDREMDVALSRWLVEGINYYIDEEILPLL